MPLGGCRVEPTFVDFIFLLNGLVDMNVAGYLMICVEERWMGCVILERDTSLIALLSMYCEDVLETLCFEHFHTD
jgi:hypothetical protein